MTVELLVNWVRAKHRGQLKKYTNEPYIEHLLRVAATAKDATLFGYEIGLCHDVIEDTTVTQNELFETLLDFGYPDVDANFITIRVVELTDVFTAETYPNLSKKERKLKEAARLPSISPGAQTVKYADLLDNIPGVVANEPIHAQQYLLDKKALLNGIKSGNKALYNKAIELIEESLAAVKQD